MTKRISWKKGMRLTDEILRASDRCIIESLNHAYRLGISGRFGLIPSKNGFHVSININKDFLDVEELECLAITQDGNLIDIKFDTGFTKTNYTNVIIPSTEENAMLLTVKVKNDEWTDIDETYCEPAYAFSLISEKTKLAPDSFPIARIVNEYGWRIDDINFIPPCTNISSHWVFEKQAKQFIDILQYANAQLENSIDADCKTALHICWPAMKQIQISMEKDIDTMSPMNFFGNIQKFISAFYCGCMLDDSLDLSEAEKFRNYIQSPYDFKDVYKRIKEGLELCTSINEKIDKFKDFISKEQNIEAPTISNSNLTKKCTNSKVRIPVENNCPGSKIYYTIDGSEPTKLSSTGNTITISSGFSSGKSEEEDKFITIKVKAYINDTASATNTYKIRLQKDAKHWIEI